jgi:serine/threonine protein phosphatase PrpC
MFRFEHFSLSVKGADSLVNDDYARSDSQMGIFVVADGMGGRPGGAEASSLAVQTFFEALKRFSGGEQVGQSALRAAIAEANTEVCALSDADPELSGLGTTLAALVVQGAKGTLVHVGDSRIYLYREGRLLQLTEDHTLIAELVKRQHVTPERAKSHALRNMLSRSVGTAEIVNPDVNDIALASEDRLLLVTDGLTKSLEKEDLKRLLHESEKQNAECVCRTIVDAATRGMPVDDVTTIVVDIKEY